MKLCHTPIFIYDQSFVLDLFWSEIHLETSDVYLCKLADINIANGNTIILREDGNGDH